ncbi:MAG: 2Fe-2S iron-sulfur cluster-binding protein [Burkholderiales bacterium]
MNHVDSHLPQPLTTALFLTFVFIADTQACLTSREVEGLNQLLRDTTWTDDLLMRSALEGFSANYSMLWKAYDTGSLSRDRERLAEELARVFRGLDGATVASLRGSLGSFAQRIAKSGSALLERLTQSATAQARRAALSDFDNLLAQVQTDFSATAGTLGSAPIARAELAATNAVASDLSMWPAAQVELSVENSWQRGRIRVRCVRVTPETQDVKSFTFVTGPARIFTFKPGQFITLDVPIDGKIVRRSFSISSSPSRPHSLTITVKVNETGTVSKWLHQNMTPGLELDIAGPNGRFSCFYGPAEKLLLIAAGSGITPLMSMLRWLSDTAAPVDVILINNVRTPHDIIFERELYLLSTELGDRFRLAIVPTRVPSGQAWNGPAGHFSESLLRYFAPDFLEREVYLCGPAGYMEAVRDQLERAGFPAHRFHHESFGAAPARVAQAAPLPSAVTPSRLAPQPLVSANPASALKPVAQPNPAPLVVGDTTCEVVFAKSGQSISCKPDDFILESAEEHGLELAYSCRAGICGTCRLSKIEGSVLMDDQTALTEQEIQDGTVLICIGRAQGRRVVLDA